jgi:hypothetical protein
MTEESRIDSRYGEFSVPHSIQTGPVIHKTPYTIDTGDTVKVNAAEAQSHQVICNHEEWCYISTSKNVIAWCLIQHRDNFNDNKHHKGWEAENEKWRQKQMMKYVSVVREVRLLQTYPLQHSRLDGAPIQECLLYDAPCHLKQQPVTRCTVPFETVVRYMMHRAIWNSSPLHDTPCH